MQNSTTIQNGNVEVLSAKHSKPRVLIFIGSLCQGGKERRLVELLTYFKTENKFELLLVMTRDEIYYLDFFKLAIPHRIIEKKWEKNDPTVVYKLFKICKEFRPQLIHAWGQMQAFYTLPISLLKRIPLINSQITGAPLKRNKWSFSSLVDKINFQFSKVILSNSKAGLNTFRPPSNKAKVIHNGINMCRFKNLPGVDKIKEEYGISTPFTVIMVAAFSYTKDYSLFYKVAEKVTGMRSDISFIGAGGVRESDLEYKKMLELSANNNRIIFPGAVKDVEALVNACTVGVLFSTNGEGFPNSIMEYMALAKPVIANDTGGIRELVRHNENGYLVTNETVEEIAGLIIDLIDDKVKCYEFGQAGKGIIEESFTLEKMGKAFEGVYQDLITCKSRAND